MLTQAEPISVNPAPQLGLHEPSTHAWPAPQELPQAPQWSRDVDRSAQASEHRLGVAAAQREPEGAQDETVTATARQPRARMVMPSGNMFREV